MKVTKPRFTFPPVLLVGKFLEIFPRSPHFATFDVNDPFTEEVMCPEIFVDI